MGNNCQILKKKLNFFCHVKTKNLQDIYFVYLEVTLTEPKISHRAFPGVFCCYLKWPGRVVFFPVGYH